MLSPPVADHSKRPPGEALVDLRGRLALLSPRDPARTEVIARAAAAYGVSIWTIYRALRELTRPKSVRRSDHGSVSATTIRRLTLLNHPTLDLLHDLGLDGMAKGFREMMDNPESQALDHAEWLGNSSSARARSASRSASRAGPRTPSCATSPRPRTSITELRAGSTARCS